MTQNFSSTPMHGYIDNPGYEYLIGIYWMKDAQTNTTEKTRYYLPAKALLSACMAIDGYVNVVGSMVDPQWENINEKTAPIKERLNRIYQNLNLSIDFKQGIWSDVLLLFGLRDDLNHFDLSSIYGMQESDVPVLFKAVAENYPIRLTHAIAEGAIELLLRVSE